MQSLNIVLILFQLSVEFNTHFSQSTLADPLIFFYGVLAEIEDMSRESAVPPKCKLSHCAFVPEMNVGM